MNRRQFITNSGLSLPLAGSLLAAGSEHGNPADSHLDVTDLADTTRTRELLNLKDRFKQPVVIREITVFRRDGEIWAQVRSQDGALGRSIGSSRQASLVSILETLIIPFFLGKDARRIESLVDEVHTGDSRYKFAGMPFFNCVAMLELAIFDLLSRTADVPVHVLLGRKLRDRIPVYLSRFTRDNRPESEAEALLAELEQSGAKAVKIKLGARMSHNRDGYPGRSEAIIPHLRKVLPGGTTIHADANGSFDAQRAIEIGRLMEEYGYGFFEEPCPWQDYEATRAVANALPLPVAGGEQDSSLPQFASMLRLGVVDIVQPDILYNGGLVRTLRVAKMAEAHGRLIVPHSPAPRLNPYLIQFAAVVPNIGPHLEQTFGPQIQDGSVGVSDEAGWGFDFDSPRHVLVHASLNASPVAPAFDPVRKSVEARRIETLRWFEDHVYGSPPQGIRTKVAWQPAANPQPDPEVAAEDGILTLAGAGGKTMEVPLKLYRPTTPERPLPTAVFICNRPREEMIFRTDADFWPMEQIVKAGWLTVAFNVKDVAHDEPAELLKHPGLLDLDSTPPGDSRGGALSAWAFVASELRGHLTRRADVASDRISVIGHSRGGKAALLAGARDPGFAVSFSSNSGCGGAAHNLTKKGEKITDITRRFPTWFCRKFSELAGRESELPYDQHHLLGCIAPRKVYVSSASDDAWADPQAEYLSCQLASPIHQFVGAKGLANETSAIPATGEKRHGGSIGYHLRQGKHNLTAWDWMLFLEFAQNEGPG
jgi:L-alanine-DL-glutamate epimerase-like enolase superfamily enzyme